jgi:hypothetical protein
MKPPATGSLAIVQGWWRANWRSMLYGALAGMFWGLLTAATVTPREWLVYDQAAGVIYKFQSASSAPVMVAARDWLAEYNRLLIQATLILLVLSAVAGWASLQLSHVRPRGEQQPSLREGADWYLIALAAAGLAAVLAFREFGWAAWLKGPNVAPASLTVAALGFLLPLYAGAALFLVWFKRLNSVRAPDWETHYPKPVKRPGSFWSRLTRRKGGGSSDI